MGNATILLRFKDGTCVGLRSPAFAVAYAVLDNTPRRLVVGIVKKLVSEPDGWDALARAQKEYSTIEWEMLPAIDTGAPTSGAAKGYDLVTLTLNAAGDVDISGTDESPWNGMEEAYKAAASGDAVHTLGLDKLPVKTGELASS
jgi:hypothetical protein